MVAFHHRMTLLFAVVMLIGFLGISAGKGKTWKMEKFLKGKLRKAKQCDDDSIYEDPSYAKKFDAPVLPQTIVENPTYGKFLKDAVLPISDQQPGLPPSVEGNSIYGKLWQSISKSESGLRTSDEESELQIFVKALPFQASIARQKKLRKYCTTEIAKMTLEVTKELNRKCMVSIDVNNYVKIKMAYEEDPESFNNPEYYERHNEAYDNVMTFWETFKYSQ